MKFTDDELRKALAENGDDLRSTAKALGVTTQAAKNRLSLLGKPRRGPGRPKGVYKKASELKPEDTGRFVLVERRREQIASTAVRHKPALRSRAQQMLRKLLAEWGAAGRVAMEIGTGASMVNHLRTGAQPNPSLVVAVELERKYGIPCVAWMEPPAAEPALSVLQCAGCGKEWDRAMVIETEAGTICREGGQDGTSAKSACVRKAKARAGKPDHVP